MKWYSKVSFILFLIFAALLVVFAALALSGIYYYALMQALPVVGSLMAVFLFIGIASFWAKTLTGQKTEGPKISWLIVVGLAVAAISIPLVWIMTNLGQPTPIIAFVPGAAGVAIMAIGVWKTIKG